MSERASVRVRENRECARGFVRCGRANGRWGKWVDRFKERVKKRKSRYAISVVERYDASPTFRGRRAIVDGISERIRSRRKSELMKERERERGRDERVKERSDGERKIILRARMTADYLEGARS